MQISPYPFFKGPRSQGGIHIRTFVPTVTRACMSSDHLKPNQ